MTLPTEKPTANGGTGAPASGGEAADESVAADDAAEATGVDSTGGVDSAGGVGGRPTLHFAYDAVAPSMDAFDVKKIEPGALLGAPAAFTVVGESHVVAAPALGFHELCSCRRLPEVAFSVPLDRGLRREFEVEVGRVRVETEASVTELDDFPGAEGADVAFRFDPAAWTTIDVDDDGYETYHTYPEYGLAVYTATRLVPTADSARPAAEPAHPAADPTRPGDDDRRGPQENP